MSKHEKTADGKDVVGKETAANVDETASAVIEAPEHQIPRETIKKSAEAKSATSEEDCKEARTRILSYFDERFKRIQTMPKNTPKEMNVRIEKGKEWIDEFDAFSKEPYCYNCSS